jgi:hypothetical protein
MKAIVKNFEVNTDIDDEYHHDIFVSGMKTYIGRDIEVEEICFGWYVDVESDYNYHNSWLEFV